MITVFTVPKAFEGHFGVIQSNAIRAWKRLAPDADVLLFGNEAGVREAAAEFGVRHVPDVACTEFGTPLLDDIFRKAAQLGKHDLLCYANADIILLGDFARALRTVAGRHDLFVLTGQRTNLDLEHKLDFGEGWESSLLREARERGELYSPLGMDYFAFRRGMWTDIPGFAVGRAAWDNWMIWSAKNMGAVVVDATPSVVAIHSNHSYAHLSTRGGQDWAWNGPEASRNRELAGGWDFIFSLHDADRILWKSLSLPALGPGHLKRRFRGRIALRSRVRSALTSIRQGLRPRSRLLSAWRTITEGTSQRG
jgi:hypothetical protein